MSRIAASVLAAVAVAAATVMAASSWDSAELLPAPAVGEVHAVRLADGSPVFVVRDGIDEVRILSAVSTHLNHVVAWCADPGVFIEPIGATRFDRQGHWLPGPAPTGLASYQATLTADRAHVRVGRLGLPAPRWERAEAPGGPWGSCAETEGADGGLFPPGTDPAAAGEVADLADVPQGAVTAVRGLIDFRHTPPRLCAPDDGARCELDAVRVAGFFWDHIHDHPVMRSADSVRGAFLVRRAGPGAVDRVTVLPRIVGDPSAYRYSVAWARDDVSEVRFGSYVGTLERVTTEGRDLLLHGRFTAVPSYGEPPPENVPATLTRVPLRGELGMVLDRGRDAPGNAFTSPETLLGRLREADAGIPVRFVHFPGMRVWTVEVFDTLDDAYASY